MISKHGKTRTRVLRERQSKTGCFTCKTRRVKCDEGRPGCERCRLSKRQCDGYSDSEKPSSALLKITSRNLDIRENDLEFEQFDSTHISLLPGLVYGSHGWPEQDRLARVGCLVLFDEKCRDLASRTQIWNLLLPQLSHAISSVNAAAAALGAIYEAHTLRKSKSPSSNKAAAIQYGTALKAMREDVTSRSYGPIALLMSCTLLTCAEILRNRRGYALLHFQACASLLDSRKESAPSTEPSDSGSSSLTDSDTLELSAPEDSLSLQFMALDIQKASYDLRDPPVFQIAIPESAFDGTFTLQSIEEAETHLIRLIHASYHHSARASRFKYVSRSHTPRELVNEHRRYIAALETWLQRFNDEFLGSHQRPDVPVSSDAYCHNLVLRAQCLSTLIYLSTKLDAAENSYDSYALMFQTIVQDASTILCRDSEEHPEQRFRLFPGIIQPLFLTASKYRHGSWRRRATGLLRRAGQEGPWDGIKMAALVARSIQIEEEHCSQSGLEVLPCHVSERYRVHGCSFYSETGHEKAFNTIVANYSRCYDVEKMMRHQISEGSSQYWEIWQEDVPFSTETLILYDSDNDHRP